MRIAIIIDPLVPTELAIILNLTNVSILTQLLMEYVLEHLTDVWT